MGWTYWHWDRLCVRCLSSFRQRFMLTSSSYFRFMRGHSTKICPAPPKHQSLQLHWNSPFGLRTDHWWSSTGRRLDCMTAYSVWPIRPGHRDPVSSLQLPAGSNAVRQSLSKISVHLPLHSVAVAPYIHTRGPEVKNFQTIRLFSIVVAGYTGRRQYARGICTLSDRER
jgi:hypothetical protein